MDQFEDHYHVTVTRVISALGRRDESRRISRRDKYQPRLKMQRPHRDNNPNSSAQQLWKSMDLFSTSSLESGRHKQKSFLSLITSPPHRTMPKILPPNPSEVDPSLYQSKTSLALGKLMGNSHVKVQEMPPQLDEHPRDDDEPQAIKKQPNQAEVPSNTASLCLGANAVYKTFPLPGSDGKLNLLPDHREENARSQKGICNLES